ncbi:DUF3658 domain-containing protein [Burkholderia sp. Ac-20353]|uniref:DUF3658 domain-containing protein n=1 Tax=Burkholderia sp. Ac-20353 TaxID=2703894 RepID=UPI00197C708A|nr:DUF3658 domain-containing protein [Burkholderia sp. Ac-20353]MBN3788247.1 hypothetical protein [Burkholderia sp. Ac-20353]
MNPKVDHSKMLHATFSDTSFSAISSAIADGRLTGSCALIGGDWHLGPLKKRNTQTLATWFTEHLGYAPKNPTISDSVATIDVPTKIFTWINVISSNEYANFLHWISTCAPRQLFLVLLPDDCIFPEFANPGDLAELLDNAVEKDSNEIALYAQEWKTLVGEDSDFRLINPTGKIQSFKSSHFDKYITNSMTDEWEPSPTVVLRIMEKLNVENQKSPGDIFFYHRLEKLTVNGTIEKQANTGITQTQIRLAHP